MKVCFLDFDGVVVTRHKDRVPLESGRLVRAATPENVAHLNTIVDRTGCVVVVSSTWRKHHTVPMLEGTLRRAGYTGSVYDVTPDLARQDAGGLWLASQRGYEVEAWLREHPEVTRYVVLDDDGDRGLIAPDLWIRCDSFVGLTAERALDAIVQLNGGA